MPARKPNPHNLYLAFISNDVKCIKEEALDSSALPCSGSGLWSVNLLYIDTHFKTVHETFEDICTVCFGCGRVFEWLHWCSPLLTLFQASPSWRTAWLRPSTWRRVHSPRIPRSSLLVWGLRPSYCITTPQVGGAAREDSPHMHWVVIT